MPKVKVTGDFMLIDPESGTEINPGEEVDVKLNSFIEERLDMKQLKLVDAPVREQKPEPEPVKQESAPVREQPKRKPGRPRKS